MSRSRILVFAMPFVLAGCATATVDIDVYKGPLGYDEALQVRHFSSLAIAAKPLLVRLRNSLEDHAMSRAAAEREQQIGRYATKPALYSKQDDPRWQDYADPRLISNVEARYINSVLQAYKDRSAMATFTDMAKARLDVARRSAEELATHGVWSVQRNGLERAQRSDVPAAAKAQFQNFVKEYVEFLYPSAPPPTGFWRRQVSLEQACSAMLKAPLTLPTGFTCRTGYGFAALLGHLSDPIVLAATSELLFGNAAAAERTAVANRLDEMKRLHTSLRTEFQFQWADTAQLVERIAKGVIPMSQQDAQVLTPLLHETLANLTHARSLACAMTLLGSDPVALKLQNANGGEPFMIPKAPWNNYKDGERYKQGWETLLAALKREPAATVDMLIRADRAYRIEGAFSTQKPCAVASDADQREIITGEGRRFGLARGTSAAIAGANELIGKLEGLVQRVQAAAPAEGFDTGREHSGIESLTQLLANHLASPARDHKSNDIDDARRRLEDALVAVAVKISYFADNSYLVREGDETPESRRMTSLLQAVGNTILSQVDDFSRRRAHIRRQRGTAENERAAFGAAQQAGTEEVIERVLSNLAAERRSVAQVLAKTGTPQDPNPEVAAANSALDKQKAVSDKLKGELDDLRDKVATVRAASEVAFHNDFKQKVEKLSTPNVDALRKTAVEWVEAQLVLQEKTPDSARAAELRRAKGYFEADSLAEADGKVSGAALWNALSSRIKGDASNLEAQVIPLENKYKLASGETGRLGQAHDALVAKVGRAGELRSRGDDLGKAEEAIRSVRAAVIADGVRAGSPRDTAVAMNLLRRGLGDAKDRAKGNASEEAKIDAALASLSTITPASIGANALKPAGDGKTAVEVLDDIITLYRQQEIQAIASGESNRATNVRKAIDLANRQRADMAYLRPPQAYLRSIYTATALQLGRQDPDANMLLPRFLVGERPKDFEAREHLDKLSWQNINTVKVAGGGRTNYVIAKDDVGNWYVKGYESDSEAIYKAARSMALFNVGQKIDVDLLRRTDLERKPDRTDAEQKELASLRNDTSGKAGSAALRGAVGRYSKAYADGARDQAIGLKTAVTELKETLKRDWTANVRFEDANRTALLAHLETTYITNSARLTAATQKLDDGMKPVDGKDPPATAINAGIVDALRELRLYRAENMGRIAEDANLLTGASKNDVATTARADAAKRFGVTLQSLITTNARQRLDSMKQYENALTIIGDVSK